MKKLVFSACLLTLLMCFNSTKSHADTNSNTPPSLWNSTPVEEPEPKVPRKIKQIKKKNKEEQSQTYQTAAEAEKDLNRPISVDKNFSLHAGQVAQSCPGTWENAACLNATSQAALVLISQFASDLQNAGHEDVTETLKQECAASTAATQKDDIPAYAMKSAYTVCANKIYDISSQTGVKPDPSYYQIMVGTVLCMSNDPQCKIIEDGLDKFK